jgi:hypothetical protein
MRELPQKHSNCPNRVTQKKRTAPRKVPILIRIALFTTLGLLGQFNIKYRTYIKKTHTRIIYIYELPYLP